MAAGLLAESITSNVLFTTKVPLLMKATSNDENPTQGYDLQEISNISKSSLPNCKSLLTFLLGRLENKSPHIKFKVLNLMKYLVINGHSEFRSGLRHNAGMVKKMTTFIGVLDPIHADGLNVNVRQAASELELLLFDVDNPEVEIMYRSMVAPNQSGKKMVGFGNSRPPPIKKELSFMDALKKVKDTVPGIVKMNAGKTCETSTGFQPVQTSQYTPVKINSENGLEGIQGDSSVVASDDHNSNSFQDSEAKVDINCHYYERKLVKDITVAGGLRSTPSKEMLKEFVTKSSSLDLEVILDVLNERLQDPSPNVQLKALCVIEYLLRCNLKNISRLIHDRCGDINTLGNSNDSTVQAKAKKIALIIASSLKLEELETKGETNAPPSYEVAKELPNVEKGEVEGYEEQKAGEAQQTNELQSLFSGMNFFPSSTVDQPVTVSGKTEKLIEIADLLGGEPECTNQETGASTGVKVSFESGKSVDILDPLMQFEETGEGEKVSVNFHEDLLWTTEQCNSSTIVNHLEDRSNNFEGTNGISLSEFSESCPTNKNSIDLLTGQLSIPTVQNPLVHRNLLPNANALSSSSERRPFPKDMKQEEVGFAFLRKKDAFSFVSDEIAASKPKQK